jgi:hypothetical protein
VIHASRQPVYNDTERRRQEIEAHPDLRAARRACCLWSDPEPLGVKLDRLRIAGIENRRLEGKSGPKQRAPQR